MELYLHSPYVFMELYLIKQRIRFYSREGREADHSPPSSAEVKSAWSYISTSPYVLITWYLVKHKDNFTVTVRATVINPVRFTVAELVIVKSETSC